MADYQLSDDAQVDLDGIYEYSILNFGLSTAQDYLSSLARCFAMLVQHREMGRDYSHIKEGYYRYEHRSHFVYYRHEDADIIILRILHGQQDPARHF